ncbi:sigma factor [Actinopolymorpha pittospori]
MTDVAEEFAAYVASRQRALVRTAYLLTGDLHEAEDLVQSALTRTYLAWHRIATGTPWTPTSAES